MHLALMVLVLQNYIARIRTENPEVSPSQPQTPDQKKKNQFGNQQSASVLVTKTAKLLTMLTMTMY